MLNVYGRLTFQCGQIFRQINHKDLTLLDSKIVLVLYQSIGERTNSQCWNWIQPVYFCGHSQCSNILGICCILLFSQLFLPQKIYLSTKSALNSDYFLLLSQNNYVQWYFLHNEKFWTQNIFVDWYFFMQWKVLNTEIFVSDFFHAMKSFEHINFCEWYFVSNVFINFHYYWFAWSPEL